MSQNQSQKRKVGLFEYLRIKAKGWFKPFSVNYQYSSGDSSPNFTHNVVRTLETNGTHHFIVNGKKLKPGTPEYIKAQQQLDKGMKTLAESMKVFDDPRFPFI